MGGATESDLADIIALLEDRSYFSQPGYPPFETPEALETAAATIEGAADWIEEFGWIQGSMFDGRKSCAVGALHAASARRQMEFSLRLAYVGGVEELVGQVASLDHGDLTEFNDAAGRTADEVITLLRHAAKLVTEKASILRENATLREMLKP